MNLRKFFNRPSTKQMEIINAELASVGNIEEKEANDHNDRDRAVCRSLNDSCPRCRSMDIVDKIARVQGHGEVHGDFSLGFGSVRGYSNTDTNGVNNCNKCGHQWKKYERNYQSRDSILKDWARYVEYFFGGFNSLGEDTVKMLMGLGVKAESISKLMDKHYSSYFSRKATLKLLRTKFKSVYDVV